MSEENLENSFNKEKSRVFRFHDHDGRRVISMFGIQVPYPRRWIELLGLVGVLTLMIVAIMRLTDPVFLEPAKKRVFQMFEITPDGIRHEVPGYIRYGFWTPGENTKEETQSVADNGSTNSVPPEVPSALEEWERDVTEERLAEFGEKLKSILGARGYRRYEVIGEGRSKTKRGWWWVVTLPAGTTPEQLGAFYRDFFKTDKTVYLETMGKSS